MPSWLPTNLAELVAWPPVRIVVLILIAILARLIAHHLIDRTVRRSIAKPSKWRPAQVLESASGLPVERRSQRILALGSLAKSLITVAVLVVTLVMVLSELGFNVTALVAGTSLIAAAVAFGTQSIVKDLLAGIFMLVEDQLGVGDYVDMQLANGTVEEIGLRVTQLRVRRRHDLVRPQRRGAPARQPQQGRAGPAGSRRCRTWRCGWWPRNRSRSRHRIGRPIADDRSDSHSSSPSVADALSAGAELRCSGRPDAAVAAGVSARSEPRRRHSSSVASSVMVVPVSAWLTGQFCLASWAAASN